MKTGKTFIISGPSGVGKSTVLRELLRYTQVFYRLCQESQSIIYLAIFQHPVDRQA